MSSYIPENRSNSVLSGRQRLYNVEKLGFRRSKNWPIKSRGVENCFVNMFTSVQSTRHIPLKLSVCQTLAARSTFFKVFWFFFAKKYSNVQKKTPRHFAQVLSVIFLDSLGSDDCSVKNLYCNKYPTFFKKSTNVDDHAEINLFAYVLMHSWAIRCYF